MTDKIQAILPAKEYIDILTQVLEMNKEIIRQNSLIVQAISLPQLIIKGDQQ
jgi:hypothetical protein